MSYTLKSIFELKEPLIPKSDFLSNLFTRTQLEAHFEHHKRYYNSIMTLTKTKPEFANLEFYLGSKTQKMYHPAVAQYWYHNLFWNNLTDELNQKIPEPLQTYLNTQFGSLEKFKSEVIETISTHFSNGWYVLTLNNTNNKVQLQNLTFSNAETPMLYGFVPILVIDLWEHAYYLDHKYDRPTYAKKALDYVNWEVVNDRLLKFLKK